MSQRAESPTDPILVKYRNNRWHIYSLMHQNCELIWAYTRSQASSKESVEGTIDTIAAYLKEHYETADPAFIELCRADLTMGPMTETIHRYTKFCERVTYHMILYEWLGKRIMYIRANPNDPHYNGACDEFNGFIKGDGFDMCDDNRYDTWWKTDADAIPDDVNMTRKIEAAICGTCKKHGGAFADHLAGIPDMYKIIVAAFDMSEGAPHLICEDILPRANRFIVNGCFN